MGKIDYKKELKQLYGGSDKDVTEVRVPAMRYLMIDGKGDPNTSEEYKRAMEALFPLAYGLKFAIKKKSQVDYGVLPLEGLWWTEGGAYDPSRKSALRWTSMIMQPEMVTEALFKETLQQVKAKKKLPALDLVRFEQYDEGRAIQIVHVGPYSEEGPTIARLHDYAQSKGYRENGKHHEIYLNDPQKTDPKKLKTILRQPVK